MIDFFVKSNKIILLGAVCQEVGHETRYTYYSLVL